MLCSVCFALRGIHFGFPTDTCSLARMRCRHLPEGFQKGCYPGAPGHYAMGAVVLFSAGTIKKSCSCTHPLKGCFSLFMLLLLGPSTVPPPSAPLHLFSPRGIELKDLTLIDSSPTYILFTRLFSFDQRFQY